uniref:Ubiquitin-like domain-containing protein n=1 Tax=Glossina brevipalpis TaxID=37001 RepID=A0A1A9WXN6_9MUSC
MDDTNTTATSTAAAVADGASAAATTKMLDTPSKTNNTTTTTTTSSTSVKLLIKASNQQYDDMTIDCDLLWTVKNLKSHLSWVYPSKPPVTDQKLIYSGQLLNDNLMLKDVIRNYKDVYTHNHIIHLVYSNKNTYKPVTNLKNKTQLNTSTLTEGGNSNMSSLDGLRQRQTATVNQQQHQQQQQQPQRHQQQQQQQQQQQLPNITLSQTQFMPNLLAAGIRCPQMSERNNMQTFATQQVAMYNWMQQIYSQYMEQCLRLSNTATGASDGDRVDNTNAPSPFTNPFLLQQYAFNMNTPPVIVPLGQIPATDPININDPVDVVADATGQQRPPVAPAPELQQVQAPAVAPRFPNIAQDDQENRDWLDSLFSVIRFMLFLTILYINSSPLRCLMVFIIAAVIYCYHIGVFRIRQERNNNNLNRNNNAAVAAAVAVDQIRQGIEQQQEQQQQVVDVDAAVPAQANDIQHQENLEQNPDTDAAGDANRLPSQGNNAENLNTANVSEPANSLSSALSFMRTFVVTFFTSLLPEMPAV